MSIMVFYVCLFCIIQVVLVCHLLAIALHPSILLKYFVITHFVHVLILEKAHLYNLTFIIYL